MRAVREGGVARLAALSEGTAARLRKLVLEELERVPSLSLSAQDEALSSVLSPSGASDGAPSRWDLRLRFGPAVREALREALGANGALGDAFEALAGNDAELYEVAALISAPGSAPQPLHSDTLWSRYPCLYTAFIALQPVRGEMGPTRFLVGTHVASAHREFDAQRVEERLDAAFVRTHPNPRSAILHVGEGSLYDGRLLHAGGANDSDEVRVLFYLTFKRADADAEQLANEEAYSLLSRYRGKFRLAQLRKVTRRLG